MSNKEYEEIESIILSKEVPHFDWLRCKGTTPSVYHAIVEIAKEYAEQQLAAKDREIEEFRKSTNNLLKRLRDGLEYDGEDELIDAMYEIEEILNEDYE